MIGDDDEGYRKRMQLEWHEDELVSIPDNSYHKSSLINDMNKGEQQTLLNASSSCAARRLSLLISSRGYLDNPDDEW